MSRKSDPGLKEAIRAIGTGDKLASALGITPQAVSQWERVPLSRVFDVEQKTGVPRHVLRPDFFEPQAGAA